MSAARSVPVAIALAVALLTSACTSVPHPDPGGVIAAVGAESQYADVIAQVGGKYVHATAIMSNPNTDPHAFEGSPSVARTVAGAELVVQNGLGYDAFMDTIEKAFPSSARKLIVVQHLLNMPDSTRNPHLWYATSTMPAVADAVATDLASIEPAHAAYFKANAVAFTHAVQGWDSALAGFRAKYPAVRVATSEPVADYMLSAAGADNMTPWALEADIMNGTDPAPQDIAAERALLADRKVQVLIYNQQVTDPLTESFITLARANGIPIVGVYETMPTPGYHYQSWMQAELQALRNAVVNKTSTERL